MKVTVRFSAQARAVAGAAEESVDLPVAGTLRDLVILLADRHGEPLRGFLLGADGAPHASLLLIVGDEQARLSDGRALRAGDVVSILTPISGG